MNYINRLKIVKWKAKIFGKPPDYVLKTKCPICGSKLILPDSEADKYMDRTIKTAEFISKSHNPKGLLTELPKVRGGVWLRWECSNDKCEFNGDEENRVVVIFRLHQ